MSSPSSNKLSHFVVGLWVACILLGLGVFGLWLGRTPSARSAILHYSPTPPTETFTSLPTFTATITRTPAPTRTSSPTSTYTASLTPTATQTPIPFSEGPIVIGKSVKSLPLEVYRYGTGPVERLIVAGMHGGGEYNTVQLVDQLMAYLDTHPEIVPPDVTLYFLHALNPDGIARALNYLGRANANGVDLNRNWPDGWKKDWDRTGCWITTYVTGGKKPASEPETQALMAFIQAHHFSGLINYHSAALGIFPGGVPPTDGSKQLAEVVAAVSTYSYPPIDTGCEYTGGMVDWTADQGIPSLDIELSDHTHTDFDMNLRILQVFLTWEMKPDQ